MTPEKIYNNCRICALHFLPQDFGANKILKKDVLPSLNLPGLLEPLEVICKAENTVIIKYTNKVTVEAESEPSTSKETLLQTFESSSVKTSGYGISLPAPTLNPVGASSNKRSRSTLLSEVNVSQVKDLTPKARHLYKRAVQFKRRAALSKKSRLSFKQRLCASEKFASSDIFKKCVSSMDRIRARFFQCQFENSDRKPKGRRYTLEDQVLALALYKQTGSGNHFLSKFFALPSRKTVMKLLKRIPICPGIHEQVFSVLKAEVKNFKKPQDKHYVLMFDEMSIQSNLQPNYHEEKIIGFEDLGFRQTQDISSINFKSCSGKIVIGFLCYLF
ncbi:uncharacterized protein LOC126737896 [Anthonomus grandis grandis]|uniref:uncharacterized protein LOC126737896 n=1 Tax=Anthonomus grandis grandis TaxID=2921223 RepID=UPI002165AF04|nr:uncharacterized protein LOC126737896 [Anthonomus grandis grandis]